MNIPEPVFTPEEIDIDSHSFITEVFVDRNSENEKRIRAARQAERLRFLAAVAIKGRLDCYAVASLLENEASELERQAKPFEEYISADSHYDNPVLNQCPLLPPTPNLHHRQQSKQETRLTEPKPKTRLYHLAEMMDRYGEKTQRFAGLPGPQDECLSLVLPKCPEQPIQIYGCPDNVDMRYPLRAELLLSILRVVSSRSAYTTSSAEQDSFDALLLAANEILYDMPLRQEKRHKRRTCRGLLKALLRLEERLYRIKTSSPQCSSASCQQALSNACRYS
ncbi:hypothetical protein XNA1_2030004 [Xenorhabdus nematophila str. Anatoliense]|nr:hypothetical protein XNA1_2030004 [Xenorhabdus nematophila str. Anatoliense]